MDSPPSMESFGIPEGDWRHSSWANDNRVPVTVDMGKDDAYNIFLRAMVSEKKGRSDRAEEAEEKFKEGLRRIFEATKELSKEVVEGFKEGYRGRKKDK